MNPRFARENSIRRRGGILEAQCKKVSGSLYIRERGCNTLERRGVVACGTKWISTYGHEGNRFTVGESAASLRAESSTSSDKKSRIGRGALETWLNSQATKRFCRNIFEEYLKKNRGGDSKNSFTAGLRVISHFHYPAILFSLSNITGERRNHRAVQ